MSNYRLKPRNRSIMNFILVQKKRWYGWRTVATFVGSINGVENAKAYMATLIKESQHHE